MICCSVSGSVSGSSRWGCYPSCCLGSQSHVQSISDSELLAVSRTSAGLYVAMHACAHCSAFSELRGLCSDDTCMTPACTTSVQLLWFICSVDTEDTCVNVGHSGLHMRLMNCCCTAVRSSKVKAACKERKTPF